MKKPITKKGQSLKEHFQEIQAISRARDLLFYPLMWS